MRNTEYLSESAHKLRNGKLLFGGSESFDLINTKEISSNKFVPEVVLTKLWVLNKEVVPGNRKSPLQEDITLAKSIRLRHFENVISFEFAALNFTNAQKNQYAYKLEGFDKDWRFVSNQHEANYTNLDAGSYVFRVKSANKDGVWNEQDTTLIVRVLPPWWESWWAYTAYAFLLFGIIYTLYFFLKKRLLL
ncbi:MAG: histidine kinase, partial [Leadbetterella sp.]|nr:histidine kinase [Leadbetterella sp.]